MAAAAAEARAAAAESLKEKVAAAEARVAAEQRAAAVELRKQQVASAEARAAEATAESMKEKVADMEARAAGSELLMEQVAAAERRAAAAEARGTAAEEWAAAAAEEWRAAAAEEWGQAHMANEWASSNVASRKSEAKSPEAKSEAEESDEAAPSWLELLAGGELDQLGEVEVISAMSEAAVAARTSADSLDDAMEKRAWLKSLDVPMWGKVSEAAGLECCSSFLASAAAELALLLLLTTVPHPTSHFSRPIFCQAAVSLSEAASEAAGMAELAAMCDAGDDVSCRILHERESPAGTKEWQEEATKAWLDKLNVPDWGAAAAVLSAAASDAAAVSAAALEALEAFGFNKQRWNGPPPEGGNPYGMCADDEDDEGKEDDDSPED